METQPRRRRGILIFCPVFLVIAGAITATVLLANDQRNLKIVMRRLGLHVTETMVIPKPGVMEKFKGKRLKGATVMIDAHAFMPEIAGRTGAFLRNMRKDGETLCTLFDRLGYKMSAWQPGSFAKNVNECYNELTIPNAADPENPSSFFLMIKGAPDGTLISTRVKFIFNDPATRAQLAERAAQVLDEFGKATHWTDLAADRDKVAALTPFTSSAFGVTARFSSEFSAPGRYNLILYRSTQLTPEQRRTADYFDRSNYFVLTPDYGGPPLAAEPAKG